MNISIGIMGLPNVGKSTLFNALLKKQAALAANYPFATIEPNVGVVAVPDERLDKLAEVTQAEEKMSGLPPLKPATVEFVDIAGLVRGASEGAGLGNKFLSHIREVKIIAHVVRDFKDSDVIREGSIDPKSDWETIEAELMLADLDTISKIKDQKSRPKADRPLDEKTGKEAAEKLFTALDKGIPAREVQLSNDEQAAAADFHLLSAKQEIVVLNVSEDNYQKERIEELVSKYTSILGVSEEKMVVICAKIESELAGLTEEDQQEYLKELGVGESGLTRLIKRAYEVLGLISFLTAGEKEVRAWTIRRGINAQLAAGEIHTDFTAKFIKAEVVSYDDFINPGGLASPKPSKGGWKKARELGKARFEGRDYIVKDGDVIEFKIGS